MPPELPLEEVTIAEALKSTGYATAAIGRWHLGRSRHYPDQHGFDFHYGSTDFGMATSQFYPRWKEGGRGTPIDGTPGEYLGDRLTGEALRCIDENKSRPLCLSVSIPLRRPHAD
jgi:arylsulfatase A-like enzyme